MSEYCRVIVQFKQHTQRFPMWGAERALFPSETNCQRYHQQSAAHTPWGFSFAQRRKVLWSMRSSRAACRAEISPLDHFSFRL